MFFVTESAVADWIGVSQAALGRGCGVLLTSGSPLASIDRWDILHCERGRKGVDNSIPVSHSSKFGIH